MRRQQLLDAFAELSAEDRVAVRAELIRSSRFETAPGVNSAMATCIEIMDRVKAGDDPVRVCKGMLDEMAGMCCQ